MEVSLMKQFLVAIVVLGCTACAHKTPVAQTPPDPTPVATVTPAPAKPAPAKSAATNVQPPRVVAQPSKPANMPADVRETLNQRLAHLEDALFDYDQSTIRSDASVALRDDVNVIRGILSDYPNQKLVIEGHTDERGSAEYNLGLGDRRAHAVQEFLSSMGIPGPQLAVVSYGKEKPVCTQETESCWQQNRRAHVTAAP
jgi:peptidoglycan-associated lipoprotein